MPDREKFVAVFTSSLTEAHIVKGRLESEGIPAFVSYESAGPVFGITVNGIGETTVWVPRALADDARKVLETETEEGDGGGQEDSNPGPRARP